MEGADNLFLKQKKCPDLETGANSWRVSHRGAGGQGQTLHQCLCFCITQCQINAMPLCAVPIHSPFFWSAVPAWARFREVTQHKMAILGAPPAVFASAALLSPGITGCACTEKWYTSERLTGFPHGSAEMCDYSLQHEDRNLRRLATSLPPATSERGPEGSRHRKTPASQSAFYREPSCPLLAKLRPRRSVHQAGGRMCSTTEQRSFGKSTKIRQWPITMRSNFRTARSCC